MLRNSEAYTDPTPDIYSRTNPERAKNNAIRQLRNLGYNVTVTPAAT